jgi:hypothetical protein
MVDSEVPLSQEKAKSDLVEFLMENLDSYEPPIENDGLLFDGWKMLCQKYGPIFIEKSPHHLVQWSAIELILECMKRVSEIEFLIVGLVRNPMDMVYSTWRRWRSLPERSQYEWATAYKNLLRLKGILGDRLVMIHYEDMVTDHYCLRQLHEFIGVPSNERGCTFLHSRSLGKWKRDKYYGFQMSEEILTLAENYGYARAEMANSRSVMWPFQQYVSRFVYTMLRPVKVTRRVIKRKLFANFDSNASQAGLISKRFISS